MIGFTEIFIKTQLYIKKKINQICFFIVITSGHHQDMTTYGEDVKQIQTL